MNNQELIPVFTGTIAGVSIQLVDARTLHAFLEVGKDFSTWLKSRITQYKFQENQDYIRLEKATNNALPKIGDGVNQGFQSIDYHLSLDMAKELSMVERNEKGREARRYFIECEKRLLSELPEFLKPITEPITLADFNWRKEIIRKAVENLEQAQVLMTITVSGKELLT